MVYDLAKDVAKSVDMEKQFLKRDKNSCTARDSNAKCLKEYLNLKVL